jgi:hypothetical protein
MYLELSCTLDILKYPFRCFLMDFMGCLYIPGNKTNNKGNIRMGMSKILEATNSLMIQSGIDFGRSTRGRKFDSRPEGRRG